METPQIPTKLSELFEQFANALPKAREAQALFTQANPPSVEAMQAEFQEVYMRVFATLDPVMNKIHAEVAENPDAIASDGTTAFGAQRVQAILAAITTHLAVALEGYILSMDCDDEMRAKAAAAAVLNITLNIKMIARKALIKSMNGESE